LDVQEMADGALAEGFGPGVNGPLLIAATVPRNRGAAAVSRLVRAVRAEPGVAGVTAPLFNHAKNTAVVSVYPAGEPQDASTKKLLTRLRDKVVPSVSRQTGLRASIGGSTATALDLSTSSAPSSCR
jgi:RND superfamily putative drug exporter